MLKLSLMEKLEVLKNIIASSPFTIITLLIIIFIGFLFITTNRHNKEESKKLYILLYITCSFALIIKYANSISSLIDYFIDHIFVLIYFPNLAVYLLAVIIVNVVMWKSMFQKDNKVLKIINTIIFCIFHYLLILLLAVISKNELNIFSTMSIYSNKEALSLIELSSFTFILWIIFSIVYFVMQKVLKKKELVLDEIPEESKYNLDTSRTYVKIEPPQQAYMMKQDHKKTIEKDPTLALYESMLTVEDYKLLLELLKEHHHKEEIKASDIEESYSRGDFQTLYGKSK